MTIEYKGIRPSCEVRPSKERKLFPMIRPAKNNANRTIFHMEVIDCIHVEINVNEHNMKTYHDFFTNENYQIHE